ncbi:lactosylceramide 4-alpha-galactosyltransferase-like [Homarus americanus]|uniref:lactosylceramide 4-alpha-galactosyltransferase-like n=1 Tax=Homarus americanus TaxID=6706 RepID=UPI001C469B28|nr:lactosylceramide 4-alpha-galactosyltransferase-like [Homarus americanus]XP_042210267.1 lactosylceramide 4-alpha-galactosyltransferase-like [Homarus americanus]
MLRNVLVWWWGGFYSDSDTICLKSVTQLHNVISYQAINGIANNALMHFNPGHPFINLVMEYLKDNFKVATWHVNGPGAATKMLKMMCNTTKLDDVLEGNTTCEGVTLLSEEHIQPIPYQDWNIYFSRGHGLKFEKVKIQSNFVSKCL